MYVFKVKNKDILFSHHDTIVEAYHHSQHNKFFEWWFWYDTLCIQSLKRGIKNDVKEHVFPR